MIKERGRSRQQEGLVRKEDAGTALHQETRSGCRCVCECVTNACRSRHPIPASRTPGSGPSLSLCLLLLLPDVLLP